MKRFIIISVCVIIVSYITSIVAIVYRPVDHSIRNIETKLDSINKALYLIDHFDSEPIDINEIAYLLLKHKSIQPEIGLKQAILECGFEFDSKVAIVNYNLFGIKHSKTRNSTAIGLDSNGYNIYSNYEDCIIDFCDIQKTSYNHNTKHNYYKSLAKYAEDSLYSTKLKNIRL